MAELAHGVISSLFRDCWSQAQSSSRRANQPRRPGRVNIAISRRPVLRAFASASRDGNPINRAVSAAERIGLLGTITPEGNGLH